LNIGLGFAQAKTLLTAVRMSLFTELGSAAMTAAEVQSRMQWHPRGVFDFLDGLVAMGLMMSLNMLIEFGDAFDYTALDFETWCTEVGFSRFEVIPLVGPASAVVAYK
jgi:hypothetical protein